MSSTPTIAVVIQGPMLSTGNSGDGTFVRDFDCSENIRLMVEFSGSIVEGFILATWRGNGPFFGIAGVKTVELDDPGPKRNYGSKVMTNDFRQAYGCLESIKQAVHEFNPDYILKVRTDQYVDIPKMFEHMIAVDSSTKIYERVGQSGYLYFPNMLSWSPFSVGDFFVAGHAYDMLKFFEAQVALSRHSFVYDRPWIHSDIMLRHAYYNLRNKLEIPEEYYFPNITPALRLDLYPPPLRFRYHPSVLSLWSKMLTYSVCMFPRDITARAEWRGHPFQMSAHSSGEFFEEWLEANSDPALWFQKRMPNLYTYPNPLTKLQLFLNFNSEKELELRIKRPLFRRHIYRAVRVLLSLMSGNFPREISKLVIVRHNIFRSCHLQQTLLNLINGRLR